MPISETDFKFISDLLLDRLGNKLDSDKHYLVEARFMGVAARTGLGSVDAVVGTIRKDPNGQVASNALEALTTNETYFFRDEIPFAVLRDKVLPELVAKRKERRALNIWSAACSTGQEAYSIAMCLRDTLPEPSAWNINILGTDISTHAVVRAREGVYNATEINRGLPEGHVGRFFKKAGNLWRVREDLQRMVRFHKMNLCRDWPALPRMDVIFLRNVLIYLPEDQKRAILSRAKSLLEPDGFLFLGAAETTYRLEERFAKAGWERSGCFRPIQCVPFP